MVDLLLKSRPYLLNYVPYLNKTKWNKLKKKFLSGGYLCEASG